MSYNKLKNTSFKRLLSLLLSACLLISSFCGLFVFANDGIDVWDGSVSAPDKVSEEVYEISTPEQLAFVIKTGGGEGNTYKLTKDIYLNDPDKINWSTGEAASGYTVNTWYNAPRGTADFVLFNGTLDGDGHVVYGLYYNDATDTKLNDSSWVIGAGLIPYMGKGSVKNIGVDKAYIYNYENFSTGALIGGTIALMDGTVDQCYVGKEVTVGGYDVAGLVGGGDPVNIRITNSYSLATLNGEHLAGGIVADTWTVGDVSAENCYTLGKATGATWRPLACTNVYQTANGAQATVVTEASIKGEAAKTTLSGFDFGSVWVTTEGFPTLKVFAPEVVIPDEDEQGFWNGTVAKEFGQGSGSDTDPYIISKGSELALAITKSEENKYYKLSKDIYLNDVSYDAWSESTSNNVWYSSINFKGHLDGDGHIVHGIWYPEDHSGWTVGLIPTLYGSATVKNVGVCDSVIVGANTGAVVGMTRGAALKIIENCFADDSVSVKGSDNASGILGYAGCSTQGPDLTVKIKNCYSKAELSSGIAANANGIIGTAWLTAYSVENCYSIGYRPYNVTHYGHRTAAAWEYRAADGGEAREGLSTADFVKNLYTDTGVSDEFKVWTLLPSVEEVKGLTALKNMPKLDYLKDFQLINGDTPKLKCFADYLSGKELGIPNYDDVSGVWNGTVAPFFEKGSGTKTDPYLISKGSELALAVSASEKGAYYKLTKDIRLNDVSISDWSKNSSNNPWFTNKEFTGHLDGDGHIVRGIWYPEGSNGWTVGLVPTLGAGGSVKNIGVCDSVIVGANAGAVVGMTKSDSLKVISNCFADATVTVRGTDNASGILGYAGCSTKGPDVTVKITNCYSKAKLSSDKPAFANGIIGTAWLTSYAIENCYSVDAMPYNITDVGHRTAAVWDSVSGKMRDGVKMSDFIKNIYTDIGATDEFKVWTLTEDTEEMFAEKAKTSMSGLDFDAVFETCIGATPKLRVFKDYDGNYFGPSAEELAFGGGKGTESDPYLIKNEAQLRYLIESKKTKNKYYKLVNDIEVTGEWYSFSNSDPAFSGTFDGCGHFIKGIRLSETPTKYNGEWFVSGGAGLFPYITTSAVIRNLHVRDSVISGKAYVGAVAGFIRSEDDGAYAEITGCSADESVTVKGQTAGGLVGGGARGLLLCYSYSTAKVSNSGPKEQCSALVGDIWSSDYKAYNCYSAGLKNFRDDQLAPSYSAAVYGTVSQKGTVKITSKQMLGTSAKRYMPELDWEYWYTVSGDTPHIRVIPEGVGITDEGVKGRPWSGKLASGFAGGSGTETDPYLIETPEQLAFLVSSSGASSGKYYKLISDIALNDTSKENWKSSAREWLSGWLVFSGYFDGNGHVVSGLYYNTKNVTYTALFPVVSAGAVIERLGVVESYIKNVGSEDEHTYAAAINALVSYKYDGKNKKDMPVFSQCFVGTDVYVEAYFAGGIACGCGSPLYMENCYSVCTLLGDEFYGGLVGNAWCNDVTIKNSYCATADRDQIGGSLGFDPRGRFTNVYVDGPINSSVGVTRLSLINMQGATAKERLGGFDFENIWLTVEGGTPVLRCFADAGRYTSRREAEKIEISFATYGGTECEPIYGFAGVTKISEEDLPVPTRMGYEFGGWHHFSDVTCPFSIDVFPDENAVLYAKWISLGFSVDFENSLDEKYDLNSAAFNFKPGHKLYNPKFLHGGMGSVYCSGSDTDPMFMINYKNPLEAGKEYTVSFWVNTRGDKAATVQLLHATEPQVDSAVVGYENIVEADKLVLGEWTEYTYTFTANAPYMIIRTAKGAELFFDDFTVLPTGKTGELGALLSDFDPSQVENEPDNKAASNGFIIVIAIIAASLVAAVAVAAVLITKKRKNKKA